LLSFAPGVIQEAERGACSLHVSTRIYRSHCDLAEGPIWREVPIQPAPTLTVAREDSMDALKRVLRTLRTTC